MRTSQFEAQFDFVAIKRFERILHEILSSVDKILSHNIFCKLLKTQSNKESIACIHMHKQYFISILHNAC